MPAATLAVAAAATEDARISTLPGVMPPGRGPGVWMALCIALPLVAVDGRRRREPEPAA